eukprot:712061-Rhodomonas_salina.1
MPYRAHQVSTGHAILCTRSQYRTCHSARVGSYQEPAAQAFPCLEVPVPIKRRDLPSPAHQQLTDQNQNWCERGERCGSEPK